jgi:hypothetical protein
MLSALITLFRRHPDYVIGGADDPYIRRWWVIPRNRFFNIYLHHIVRSDDDRALHDHPWLNMSILLRGSYREVMPHASKVRRAGAVVLRRSTALHRLEIFDGGCWSLFITGPRIREWGFMCPQGWRHWKVFTSDDGTRVGRGCE